MNPQQTIIAAIVAYSFCSGTLVLLNKLTLHFLPFPSLVVCFQLFACVVIIYGAMLMKIIDVDPIQWKFVKPYLLYILFFSSGIYCNMRSLNISNVETVIVFRSLTPIAVAILDALFLGREWPSRRSWAGLSTLVAGAYGYASFDEEFQTQGYQAYMWPTAYTCIIALEMVSLFSICMTRCYKRKNDTRTICLGFKIVVFLITFNGFSLPKTFSSGLREKNCQGCPASN